MQKAKIYRILRLLCIPLLFCGVAIGLVAVQSAWQRKAERASAQTSLNAVPGMVAKTGELPAAADDSDLAARLEMGRRFIQGRGVGKSESRAAAYFEGVIAQFGEISPHDKRGPQVASALLQMARLYKNGVPEAHIHANPAQAFSFLHHAASYFGDPAAQFELAELLLRGDGVTKNTRAAAQWLLSASRKGYAPAQARLGEILWRGRDGVKRVPGDGLGLLAIARRNASNEDRPWVSKIFEAARSEALPAEILEANAFIVQELNASHFALTNDILINGESGESETLGLQPSAAQPGQQQGAISGNSKALSELEAMPTALPSTSFAPELAVEAKDTKASAGIIQMYRVRTPEAGTDNGAPIRYAGYPSKTAADQ